MTDARAILNTFTEADMPDLDTAVMGALELFSVEPQKQAVPIRWDRILVVGSGNARAVGEILFHDVDAVYADESTIDAAIACSGVGGAVLISASGGKHAVSIAKKLHDRRIPTILLTTKHNSLAAAELYEGTVIVYPKNREPYTYNTSTYLGMILAETGEDAGAIRAHIESVQPDIDAHDFTRFSSFVVIVPPAFHALTSMIRTKFDELFGPFIQGRAFTEEEIKHAKTVVTSPKECFISIGVTNDMFGLAANRIEIPAPEEANYGAMMALAYYTIGVIQRQHPPYFKNNIAEYTKNMSQVFNQQIKPIVE